MGLLALLFGSFLVLILLRVPVSFALGLASLLTAFAGKISPTMVIQQTYRGLDSFPLLAVPFFLLVGQLMNDNGVTDRLIKFSNALVGHIKGGLGHVNIVVSMIFAGLSGSSQADTAGIGSVLIPAMIREGYDRPFSVAVTAASSTMGVIIPPSIMMIIYGAMGGVSIGALFLAGAIPGVLIGLGQMALTYYFAIKRGYPAGKRATLKQFGGAFREAALPLAIPVILIGGITSGVFTPTEASMITAVYSLALGFLYRSVNLKQLPKVFKETVLLYSLTLICVGTATSFGWLMAYLKAPELILDLVAPVASNPTIILLIVMALFLIVGCLIDAVPAIIIFLPLLNKLGAAAGINPIHMGIVVVMTLSLGLVTPPYGVCLLLASRIGGMTVRDSFVAILPFVWLFMVTIVLIILVPQISLFLPSLFMPQAV
ncbi:TRAP transporter large permease [Gelria sp. Kuro-4]|uniref:TRAP transporter large permease n=1 Tax=Gelria sp. Kuro-4 TaxID=2796927 RepID=UPI001BEFF4EA|nr:TRAP transporter large permease [Gelria sp. Kuro-4]BCV24599.1 membrane protein [Gelria sp. Kuro-4]